MHLDLCHGVCADLSNLPGSLERSLIPESFIRKGPSCSQASAHPLCGTTRFAPVVAASGLRRVEARRVELARPGRTRLKHEQWKHEPRIEALGSFLSNYIYIYVYFSRIGCAGVFQSKHPFSFSRTETGTQKRSLEHMENTGWVGIFWGTGAGPWSPQTLTLFGLTSSREAGLKSSIDCIRFRPTWIEQ